MFPRLILLFLAVPSVWSTPTETIASFNDTEKAQPVPELSRDLLSKIVDLTDKKTCFTLGCTSRTFNGLAEHRNKRNRLMRIKEFCGFEKYLDLTSNGHYIFTSSIYPSPIVNLEMLGTLKQDTLCNYALETNIYEISDRLTQLTIRLPSWNVPESQILNTLVNSYFESLEALFKKKSNFKKIIVTSVGEWAPMYLHQEYEEKLFKILSSLIIDEVVLRMKVQQPSLLVNPSITKLSAQEEFYRHIYGFIGLPHLKYVRMPDEMQPAMLEFVKFTNIEELEVPTYLVSEALSHEYSFEKLIIYDMLYQNRQDHITALMETTKPLKGLTLGWNVCPSVLELSPILQKFKPSLETLALNLQTISENSQWVDLLRIVLIGNKVLKSLSVCTRSDGEFNHSFLDEALNLQSYSYSGELLPTSKTHALMDFISSHSSLRSLTLNYFNLGTAENFFSFFKNLVSAIQANPTIENVQLVHHILVVEFRTFANLFSEIARPLMGRGLIFNTIPIENIVADLAQGLEVGLFWKVRGQRIHLGVNFYASCFKII